MNTVQEAKPTVTLMPGTPVRMALPSLRSLRAPVADPFRRACRTAQQPVQTIAPVASAKRIKAAGYARVSTNSEEQKSSIDIQRQHFASIAATHEDWEFTGIYYDIVSGTKAEKRPQLQQLLADCRAGKVNLVLTKSVSRFARNTTDLLSMVRSLTALGVDIIFDWEHLDTRTMGSEFLLTILASLAEDESHSISANCRWGIQARFRDGSYRAASAPYGYDLVDGTYEVNEQEAKIVREIFERTLDGESSRKIAEDLNRRGIPTKRAGQVWNGQEVSGKWTHTSIYVLLQNEAYVGDMILQKTYSDATFKRVRNEGAYPQYHLEDHHEAIIDRDTFEKVREIRMQRSQRSFIKVKKHLLTGRLICNHCGAPFVRQKNRCGNVYWVCRTHRKKGTDCLMPQVSEEKIWDAFRQALLHLKDHPAVITEQIREVERRYRIEHAEEIEALEEQLRAIEAQLTDLDAIRNRLDVSHADRITRQNELKIQQVETRRELDLLKNNRIEMSRELLSLLHSLSGSFVLADSAAKEEAGCNRGLAENDREEQFRSMVGTVTVYGRERFGFHFLCGLIVTADVAASETFTSTEPKNSSDTE